MNSLRTALIPIARVNFDMELAGQMIRQFRQNVAEHGFEIIGPEEPVTNADAAQRVARSLGNERYDLMLIFQATFADSTMITALAEASQAPIFLWAVPDERTGGRLRLNSLCGVNLAAHALTRRSIGYEFAYAPPDDEQAFRKVRLLASAGHLKNRLRQGRFGVVGERPAGMDTCDLDEANLAARLGVQVTRIPLEQVFAEVQAMPQAALQPVRERLSQTLHNLDGLDQAGVNGTMSIYLTLQRIAHEQHLDGIAVRCWPEFFEQLKCAACGAISMLTDDNLPCSCEADINGTITQAILQWASGSQAMGTDLVAVDGEADEFVLWHCGLAPLSMADPNSKPRGTIHSNRKVPLLMEFTLKPGRVTLARLSHATNELRLVVSSGKMVAAPASFSGTSGVVRFDRPAAEVLDDILRHGLEHHLAFTYGDYRAELLKLAELLELPVLEI